MQAIARAVTLVLAAGTLTSFSAARPVKYSAELLSLLDPGRQLSRLCGGKGEKDSMRARLMLAAKAVQGAPATSAPLYAGLGKVHFPITTSSPLAQRYFDQGLSFAYGFNHAGAIASFREAQRLDPECALCFWGEALAQGPNINVPMDAAVNTRAIEVTRRADLLARKATPLEQALTAAMLKRYSAAPDADRSALNVSYADAMLAVARVHPGHDDVALLAAEAAMNTRPWDYWDAARAPYPRIGDAVQLVETVLARNADHPQAAHLYIHLLENGPDPKRAEAAADRLAKPLAPQAGHLVHMPAHIYYLVGRWKDAMRINVDAARADEEWIRATGDKGMVRYGYYPHNVHFIVTSAQMAGDMATAIREARRLEQLLDPETSAKVAWIQAISAAPYFAAAQFATPDQILAMRAPDARLPYAVAMRHYARAVARAGQRNRSGFDQEMAALRAVREGVALQPMVDQGVPARDLVQVAESVARARWAQANGQLAEAATEYRNAVAIEDKIPYNEPPYWYYPVQQSLGAALFQARRYDEARTAFRAALVESPGNGWALYGLAAAERALGNGAEAAAADAALARAWAGDRKWLRMDRL